MSATLRKVTVEELETFPADGFRYEIIGGDLTMSPARLKRHQRLLGRLHLAFANIANSTGTGECFFSPVDVMFSEIDQVQPDLIFIKKDHAQIYQGHTVFGAPDIVVEVLSPSNKAFDEVSKFELYQANGVPEYWIVDPEAKLIRLFVRRDGALTAVAELPNGRIRSRELPGLEIIQETLFHDLDS